MPKNLNTTETITSENLFPVVGIGASAGGLEAFKKFIHAVPNNSHMAFILVQHLHPGHSSSLPQILQRETDIPVSEISDNIKVKPDNIYIIPANKLLVANDGVLHLSPRPKDQKNMPIDIFFESLAEVHQSHAIGIVLSGTGTDGTIGLKKIKDYGGITFCQDTASAAYDDMPQNAIKSEIVDFILSPEEMPGQLMQLEHTFSRINIDGEPIDKQINEEESFRQILALIRVRNGADFTYYKQTTVRRRILRRIAILKLEKIGDYFKYLQQNKTEQDLLFQDLLIPVTGFFRDPKTFEYICQTIFPELLKNKSVINPLRIWIAGCSTGEEAYSFGICLYEYLSDKVSNIKIQIFSTDISEQSIAKARAGIFEKRQLEGLSDIRLQQFFTRIDGTYQVKKVIRDMCVFAVHNFLKDPPFAKMDLISCRNVLIYMEPFLQKKAFTIFHYALNDKGTLVLGKSETTGSSSELFFSADKKDKIYTRKSIPGKFMNVKSIRSEEVLKNKDGAGSNERKKDDIQKNADDILLAKYTPAGVIVNEAYDIVQFRGSTGAFLEPSPGKASLNLLKMAKEGLSFELRNALLKSRSTNEIFVKKGIPLNNRRQLVTIEVIPLLDSIDLHFLILFKDEIVNEGYEMPGDKTIAKSKSDSLHYNRIKQLEKDLAQTREDMRGITEEQEAANEELQSANEELLSGSEELQSLNEELETSKEELQSTNEELITVNQELFDRNEQLNQARLYAEGIITTIHEPMLVLTADFRIKSANNSFYKNFSLTEKETLGKKIFQLQNDGWNIPGLSDRLLNLSKKKSMSDEWEVSYSFPVIGQRIICFNAQPVPEEAEKHLILLALDDITARKEAGKIQEIQNLQVILESIPQVTFSAAADGTFTYFNNFFLEYAGITLKKAKEGDFIYGIEPEQQDEINKAWKHSIQTLENFNKEFQLKRKSDGMYRWHTCRATAIINEEGIVTAWVGAASDIDDHKKKDQAKDEFIHLTGVELKTPLISAKAFVQLLEKSMESKEDTNLIYVQKTSEAISKITDLIVDLMDVSKIKSGKPDLHITSFDFNELIKETVDNVQQLSKKHAIQLTGKIKRKVNGDKEKLRQVMVNLLDNAIKYSPDANKVFVHIVQDKSTLKVSIKDEGIGVYKKNLNNIFTRYYKEERKGNYPPGLGIGLFISKEIISRHGGNLWAESEPGKGSVFYFTIPF